LIEECSRLDAELYAFASGLFGNAVPAVEASFAADVETLRGLSAELNEQAIQKAQHWLDHELPPGAITSKTALYSAAEAAGIPEPALKHVLGSRHQQANT
jgi:hypothetical protein